jgi:hypothetical protein
LKRRQKSAYNQQEMNSEEAGNNTEKYSVVLLSLLPHILILGRKKPHGS